MYQDFKGGTIFSQAAVWENSLLLLSLFGVLTPSFIKRIIRDRALNLFDGDLFRKNNRLWKFNGKKYESKQELIEDSWSNYSGSRVYNKELKERVDLLLGWGVIIKIRDCDLGDEDLVFNPINFILDSEKQVNGRMVRKFRLILHWKLNCAAKIPAKCKPEVFINDINELKDFDLATTVDAAKCFYRSSFVLKR